MTYDTELRQSRGFYRGIMPTRSDTRRTPPSGAHDDAMRLEPLRILDTLINPQPPTRDMFKQMGYTGSQCSNCNSSRMKVSGHCEVCEECGTTTGCS